MICARGFRVDVDAAGTDDSELRFVGVAAPGRLVAAVDRIPREAAERAAEPRFGDGPGPTGAR